MKERHIKEEYTALNNLNFNHKFIYSARIYKNLPAYLLLVCFGGFGVHHLYLGKWWKTIVMILLMVLSIPTMGVSFVVLSLWLLVDLIALPSYVREANMDLIDRLSKVSSDKTEEVSDG